MQEGCPGCALWVNPDAEEALNVLRARLRGEARPVPPSRTAGRPVPADLHIGDRMIFDGENWTVEQISRSGDHLELALHKRETETRYDPPASAVGYGWASPYRTIPITEVQRWRPEEGDRLIVSIDDDKIPRPTQDEARVLREQIRAHLHLRSNFPVALFYGGIEVKVVKIEDKDEQYKGDR
jgi:hypothetical protein